MHFHSTMIPRPVSPVTRRLFQTRNQSPLSPNPASPPSQSTNSPTNSSQLSDWNQPIPTKFGYSKTGTPVSFHQTQVNQSDFSIWSANPTDQSSQLQPTPVNSMTGNQPSPLLQGWNSHPASFHQTNQLEKPDQPANETQSTSQPSQLQSTERPEWSQANPPPTHQRHTHQSHRIGKISKISPKRLRHFYPVTSFRGTHDQSNQFPLVQTGIPAENSRQIAKGGYCITDTLCNLMTNTDRSDQITTRLQLVGVLRSVCWEVIRLMSIRWGTHILCARFA